MAASEAPQVTPPPGGLTVVLSSYNGAAFISAQLDSIRRQTLDSWSLLVRDDGSTDGTPQLLDAIARDDPRVDILHDSHGNLGPLGSFARLMEAALAAGASYVAFADQDDVWQPDKLERQLAFLRAREVVTGSDLPLLLHTDLAVVDERLRLIHPSFLAMQGLLYDPDRALARLLAQNVVTGCTVMANRALLRVALPVPAVVMHDWWLGLCAASMGELHCLPQATVRYRQHGSNAAGSRSLPDAVMDAALAPLQWWHRSGRGFAAGVAQACALAERLQREALLASTRPAATGLVREYCRAFSGRVRGLARLGLVRRLGVEPRSALRRPLLYYLRVARWRPSARPAPRDDANGSGPDATGRGGTAVVIVNWNGRHLLEACLTSVAAQEPAPVRIIVVDNGSSDGSLAYLRERWPAVTALDAGANLGFPGGNNVGIREALSGRAADILLLNTDAELRPGALAELQAALRMGGTAVWAAAPKIVFRQDPARIWSAGGRFDWWRGLSIDRGSGERDGGQYDRPDLMEFANACCLLIRGSVFRDGGLLDEGYFMYFEDSELSARAARAGLKVAYHPAALVLHDVQGSSAGSGATSSPTALYYWTRNRPRFISRNAPGAAHRLVAHAYVISTRLVRMAQAVAAGRTAEARLIARAMADGYLRGATGPAYLPQAVPGPDRAVGRGQS